MNFRAVKVWLCKLVTNLVLLLFMALVPAVAAGVLPFWAALLLGLGALLGLNAACGVLLGDQPTAEALEPAPLPQQPTLRVVRGGRAA